MTFDVLRQFLRWTFWGLVYLMTICGGILASLAMPVPQPVRMFFIATVLYGIAVDILHKHRADTQRA